ncbi:uncharacterized protein LOC62_06G007862 [Vanrija pseudolonga]|uniref:Uncharacterized protein n=1 Tax=Vanrija pseudolonga TaxID=143232 RepID=A0AAF1BKU1_9TREE|nr:hypothetical protein LOC62_06G007862 [Vanrija pseudolonga]
MCPTNGKPEIIVESNVRDCDKLGVIAICRFTYRILSTKMERHLDGACQNGSSSSGKCAQFYFKANPTYHETLGTLHINIVCSQPLTASEVHWIRWTADKWCNTPVKIYTYPEIPKEQYT